MIIEMGFFFRRREGKIRTFGVVLALEVLLTPL